MLSKPLLQRSSMFSGDLCKTDVSEQSLL